MTILLKFYLVFLTFWQASALSMLATFGLVKDVSDGLQSPIRSNPPLFRRST
jgi:hypothetical protein